MVLVSPIGNRPGVLFSAIKIAEKEFLTFPDRCLVVCSEQSGKFISEACREAGFSGKIIPLVLKDPFGGLDEIGDLVGSIRKEIFGAEAVMVNVTGGTTLMWFVAEEIAKEAGRLASPVYRFGLIDRRPSEEQASQPYKVGDAFWLDSRGKKSEPGDTKWRP